MKLHIHICDPPGYTIYYSRFGPVSSIYIWSEIFGSPTGQKVKPDMADMEALSYIGFSPPAQFNLIMPF